MRWFLAFLAVTAWTFLPGGGAFAADANVFELVNPQPASYWRPDRFEIRGGGFAHCCFAESNSAAVGGEIVFPRLIRFAELPDFLSPRIHAGAVIDLKGHTSYGFAGLLSRITSRSGFSPRLLSGWR
jgi:hypothetical protein